MKAEVAWLLLCPQPPGLLYQLLVDFHSQPTLGSSPNLYLSASSQPQPAETPSSAFIERGNSWEITKRIKEPKTSPYPKAVIAGKQVFLHPCI